MSFATSLKRAFGFRTEADEEEFDTSLPTYAAGDRDSDQESESASDTVANHCPLHSRMTMRRSAPHFQIHLFREIFLML